MSERTNSALTAVAVAVQPRLCNVTLRVTDPTDAVEIQCEALADMAHVRRGNEPVHCARIDGQLIEWHTVPRGA